ncbi:hypothetical protein CEUSTIGMA_g5575.t1 [Chlamydomonas eustigma]|uniref:EF-hand domain-containing protein n=1 Tax=Chlamydomonas eustigma TaxID=1157962 RepID=A0A250X4Y0_9CHLO|nr:hypothetical protein CEUSTIGMA_g5575.t1 [Chlamydomonas eustigma]|eukprot:GAX78133.1 hypothetical protein CEUSTIGMA_g5575.t1 [Chlamydomonas eustigma]
MEPPASRGAKVLPMLSLLSDRTALKPTLATEDIMKEMSEYPGLSETSWDQGGGFKVHLHPPSVKDRPKPNSILVFKANRTPQHKARSTTTQGPGFTLVPTATKLPATLKPQPPVPSESPMQALSSLQQRLNTPPPPSHMLRALSETGPTSMPSPRRADHNTPEIVKSPKEATSQDSQLLEARPSTALTQSTVVVAESDPQREEIPSQIEVHLITTSMEANNSDHALSKYVHTPKDSAASADATRSGATPAVQTLKLPSSSTPVSRGGTGVPSSSHSLPGSRGGRLQGIRKQYPMAGYIPTRAQALNVFGKVDMDQNSKITYSEFEIAALSLGFSTEDSRKFFSKLDHTSKGFLTPLDWGSPLSYALVERFTLLYMRTFLGLPPATASPETVARYLRELDAKKTKDLQIAIKKLGANAVRQASKGANKFGDIIYDAFKFIDTDNSGKLSKDELSDGFAAFGVLIDDSVTDKVMELFDRDKNGTIEYHEFVSAMFGGKYK